MSEQEKQYAVLNCTVKEAKEDDSRVLRFVGSTSTRDRMGDEIKVGGWDLDNYRKNPVFLWAHNYRDDPRFVIGKALNVEKKGSKLLFDIEFIPADVNPTAEQVYQLYKHGYLSATSVGFMSNKSKWIDTDSDEEEKKRKEKPDREPGKIFKSVELLELSAVPVPANPEALIAARSKGLEMPDELKEKLNEFETRQISQEAIDNTRDIKERIESYTTTTGFVRVEDSDNENETNMTYWHVLPLDADQLIELIEDNEDVRECIKNIFTPDDNEPSEQLDEGIADSDKDAEQSDIEIADSEDDETYVILVLDDEKENEERT